jgi:uncharacterized protein (TIGR02145 family)
MTQFLKKFDNVLLASMKKANNNSILNTIRINGVLLPKTPTPTPTPTITLTPTKTQTPTPTSVCSAPILFGVTLVNGSTFTLNYSTPTNCTLLTLSYSRDQISWSNSSGGCTTGRQVTTGNATGTWFFRLTQNCSIGGGPDNSNVVSYTYSQTPTPTPTLTKTPGSSPTQTPSQTPTNTVTPTKTLTPTVTPTKTLTPTVTKTQTPTPSVTRTQTPTPTSNPNIPSCSVLYNDNQDKVYYYNVLTNSSTEINMPNQYVGGFDIAHTLNKLWEPGPNGDESFNEYNITLPSFTITYNRNILYPSGYIGTAGLAAISDTVILAVNGDYNPQQVVEIDVSGVSAIMTTKFSLITNRYITGDFYKTTTNKFLALNTDIYTDVCYLSQWNYLTGVPEADVQLTGIISCGTYGIFEYNSDIYITATDNITSSSNTYIINKNSPYNAVYSNTINKFVFGASQVFSCLTTNLNAPSPYLCSLNDVTIGTQTWTACNLNVPTYRDGTVIPKVTDPAIWSGLTTGAWCYYSGSTTTGNTYGMLYNWYAVNNTANGGLAPLGYHIPTDAEWTTLTTFLGGESVSGGILKETGTILWNTPNTGAVNTYGFTALPGGNRSISGVFTDIRNGGYWWTSSEFDSLNALGVRLNYDDVSLNQYDYPKCIGFSVRCVMDY